LVCTTDAGCTDVTDAEGAQVRLAGLDVTYLDTGRRGTEHAGSSLLVTVA
jgi:hypothetical protein